MRGPSSGPVALLLFSLLSSSQWEPQIRDPPAPTLSDSQRPPGEPPRLCGHCEARLSYQKTSGTQKTLAFERVSCHRFRLSPEARGRIPYIRRADGPAEDKVINQRRWIGFSFGETVLITVRSQLNLKGYSRWLRLQEDRRVDIEDNLL